jgi:hypothetical protein
MGSIDVRVVVLSMSSVEASADLEWFSTWRAARTSTEASFSRFSSEPAVSVS